MSVGGNTNTIYTGKIHRKHTYSEPAGRSDTLIKNPVSEAWYPITLVDRNTVLNC